MIETRPLKLFEDAGAKVGLAGVDMDNDLVVRYIPSYENTYLVLILSLIKHRWIEVKLLNMQVLIIFLNI